MVEVAPDFPKTIRLEGMPETLQVVGIPSVIEVVGMPSFIQLVMPENPTVELVWKGAPFELGLKPEVEKLLRQVMIQ